jgi:serine/threonine protein kinase
MVQPDGLVKLLDFGLARNPMQRPALLIGTLNYVAPEFLKGEPVDSRSDIFSTGVMLYQLLSGGIFPFSGNDFHAVANQIVNSPRLPLSKHLTAYLPELDGILNRALAKDPNHRYSAAEFETDLIALRNKLDGQLGHLLQLARHEMSSGSVRVFEIINQIKAINPNLPELKDLLTNVYVKQKQEMEENLMSFSGAVVRSRRSYRTWVGEKIRRGAVVMADYAGWLSFVDRRVITSYLRYSQSSKMPEIVVDINRILLGSGMSALVLVGSWMLWMKGCQ